MRTLYTIAYLDVADAAHRCIDRIRAMHDPQHGVVEAHFTLLFGDAVEDEAAYAGHVRAVAGKMAPIRFHCRRAVTGAGLQAPTTHVYLVPDEGGDAIARLHDRLYGGPMRAQRRADIPYLPHITVATKSDADAARTLCASLNSMPIDIAGRIERLSIGTLQDGRFVDLSHHALAAA